MRISRSTALLLACTVSGAHAANSSFDRAWDDASKGPDRIVGHYQMHLQAYFDKHRGYRACDLHLEPGTGVRMLLRFDADGGFRTEGESKNPHVERCLSSFFHANQPPTPPHLPGDLPFWFE